MQSFEQKMAADQTVSLWFQKSEKRLWDRSVVGFTQVSAEALAENLFAKLQLPLPQAWEKIETTNMCRWNSVRMYNTWWEPLPQENSLRGLLIFSAGILNTKDFANLVLSSYEEIKTLQTWS